MNHETYGSINKYHDKLLTNFWQTSINKSDIKFFFHWNKIINLFFTTFFNKKLFSQSSKFSENLWLIVSLKTVMSPKHCFHRFYLTLQLFLVLKTLRWFIFLSRETCGVESFFFIQSILYWPISFNLVQKFYLLLLQTWIEFYRPLSVFIVQWELNFSWWWSFIVREHNKKMLYSS